MPTLNRQVRRWAEDDLQIDWAFERARVEDKLLRDEFGGRKKEALSPVEREDFEKAVDQRVDEIDQEIRRTQIPASMERYERKLAYLFALRSSLLMLAADPKGLDLSLRVIVPLED